MDFYEKLNTYEKEIKKLSHELRGVCPEEKMGIRCQISDIEKQIDLEIINCIVSKSGLSELLVKKCFDKAYEDYHSNGYQAVYEGCLDLTEFVKNLGIGISF